ncbi:polysaccharide biosynthesis/export family protein [Parachlamydia sp. AcF125]|uniref:polysaccharide biosynthesis/export family protein n=1 Tax=Parachlamydia sp. AcF125 TaxID=2795736 RepID=UPI001BC91588|nr:polysaccharide biosynthesis/export family protein [Parachlamydia sp. AcF125]MBS4167925.1 hypothetical protein [Parachlamydia sp. AcF125]
MCLLLLVLLFLHASSYATPYNILDAGEFVLDSQKIQKEGKFAIEELQGHLFAELPNDAFTPYYPIIDEEDILTITLYHPSRRDLMAAIQLINDRAGGFRVVNGKISLPGLNALKVKGMTLPEARQKIKEQYREQISGLEVYLSFKSKAFHKIIVTGMVSPPPSCADGQLRLYEVLSKAFIPPTANLFASYVLRENMPLRLDLFRLLKKGDMSQNIVMKGGDKIFIASPTDQVAMVLGEVLSPKRIPLLAGYISLKEALTLARGMQFTANKNHIQVIRGNISFPKIYSFPWEVVAQEPNQNLLLIPGDVVYISRKAITEWALFMRELEGTIRLIPAVELIHKMSK